MRQYLFQSRQIIGRSRRHHVEDSLRTGSSRGGEHRDQFVRLHAVHEQIAAQVQNAALRHALQRNVGGAESGVGAEGVDKTTILTGHVDDKRLAGVQIRADLQGGDIDLALAEHVGEDAAKHIATDTPHHRRRHAQLDQIDGDVGGAAADGQQQLIGQHQLARAGKCEIGELT